MNKNRLRLLLALTLGLCCFHPAVSVAQVPASTPSATRVRPKLILQITVDQLRGDEPFRYSDRFVRRGFRYLMDEGIWYLSANHPHAHTETAVGHTTLATGAYPSRHGLIGDSWFDRATGKDQDGVEDTQYPQIGNPVGDDDGGASPLRIQTTTFSDELTMTTARGAKVFAVSGKDRGAIPMSGQTGKAFWFSTRTGEFVTSTYYYKSYPAWVTSWNQKNLANNFDGKSWNLLEDLSTYLFAQQPPFAQNQNLFGFNNVFPHPFGKRADNPTLYYTKLTVSPFTDDLTLQFAEELIEREGLGADDVPDYLAIGFSSTDIIGHIFGPSSLESEDNLLRLDRTLDQLFKFVDERVGLQNTLIVLSGDHGAPEVPAYLQLLGVNTGWLKEGDIQDAAVQALNDHFGRSDLASLILKYKHPYFYVNYDVAKSMKLDELEVERTIAAGVMKVNGIAFAVPCRDLPGGGEEADAQMIAEIQRNQFPVRSGDVYVVQQSEWQVAEKSASGEPPVVLINHGSPWAYDTFVPVAFAGMRIPAARVSRQIYTVDVAATLAAFLRTNKPSGSVGAPLVEVLDSEARDAKGTENVRGRRQ
jgi:predicted AlkP superfamily pyrophosphatase or phosphodiesterase